MANLAVSVQEHDFDPGQLQEALLAGASEEGAVATFTGYVRVNNDDRGVSRMMMEHYPGMTEKSIESTLNEATQRWPLIAASVVHRIGELTPGERIVWVGVSSRHRGASFSACEYIMDYLKTNAPFWKKEIGPDGEHWVEARDTDTDRARRWAASE
ncbi:MAG: molybdopterin synthase catalytic subunit MoaE [Halieaceae bacterium]